MFCSGDFFCLFATKALGHKVLFWSLFSVVGFWFLVVCCWEFVNRPEAPGSYVLKPYKVCKEI